ncbi:MAG: amino acid ABC transporter ATP-binding protein, partial [Fusobacteriaceae bacterium]|nr:amino acid ABC transporter ATP-binding protein [Fusobacteriaceae bacterium]
MISVKGLIKKYGNNTVLKGIDFLVEENQVVSLIGPSGSGKSTLLRCLNGLEEATEGHIFVNSSDITDVKLNINHFRENVGMVFQSFNLFPHLSVIDNITLAPISLKKMNKSDAEELALQLLEQVGLKEKAYVYPNSLSGGQKQRVAIA